ncbi:MAG TPA: hypothetical protein VHD90_12315 [Phototrophicaceae bacterium]|nr:hypothetical protein [Phototrophicaceae bacterium]
MSRASISIYVYSVYLIGQGLVLLVAPNFALGLFGLPAAHEVWVRVLGYALISASSYLIFAARRDVTDIFIASIVFRIGLLIAFAVFVALGYAPSALLLLAPADVIFALWTAWAIWSVRSAPATPASAKS